MSEIDHEDTIDTALSHALRAGMFFVSIIVCGLLAVVFLTFYFNSAPDSFRADTRISIPPGSTLTSISDILKDAGVVRSSFLFSVFVIFHDKEASLRAGEYLFPEKISTAQVAQALMSQDARIPPHKVTIPEGSTLEDFDRIISDALPLIEPGSIVREAKEKEGVLFPDTYLIEESSTASEAVALLKETFDIKLTPLKEDIARSVFSQEEIIILASLIEREAKDEESMKIVSGILQNRLAMHMPLQVDATFEYLYHKKSADLTHVDLTIDDPFNTYLYRGLPPSPIASPGMRAIEAVLFPTQTKYLYYLTDAEGVFHYAETFDEHKRNKARYLRQ